MNRPAVATALLLVLPLSACGGGSGAASEPSFAPPASPAAPPQGKSAVVAKAWVDRTGSYQPKKEDPEAVFCADITGNPNEVAAFIDAEQLQWEYSWYGTGSKWTAPSGTESRNKIDCALRNMNKVGMRFSVINATPAELAAEEFTKWVTVPSAKPGWTMAIDPAMKDVKDVEKAKKVLEAAGKNVA